MTRVNRPDTLLTELRELQRRLRLLEGSRMSVAAPLALMRATETTPLLPARPSDWPSTHSEDWERLLEAEAGAGSLTIRVVADPGTTGTARTTVDGTPVGDEIPVTTEVTRHVLAFDGGSLAVQARRVDGPGAVHVQAWLT